MTQQKERPLRKRMAHIYWINSDVLPWLGGMKPYKFESLEDALARAATPAARDAGVCYFLNHSLVGRRGEFCNPQTHLVECILEQRQIPRVSLGVEKRLKLWRLRPADLRQVAADLSAKLSAAQRAAAARRATIPDGQVVLADDPAFQEGAGWSGMDYDDAFLPRRWTEGSRQKLTWAGPERPGVYRLQVRFNRPYPYPAKVNRLRYRLPGQAWREREDGLGPVILEDVVTVARPRQPLTLELETAVWVPGEHLNLSNDWRPLGMLFTAIELRPLKP